MDGHREGLFLLPKSTKSPGLHPSVPSGEIFFMQFPFSMIQARHNMPRLNLLKYVRKLVSGMRLLSWLTYAEYQLGKIYCFGQGVPQNLEVGMEWLKASASHGNEYASTLLEKVQNHIHRQTTSAVFGLFRGLAGMIQTSSNNFIRRRNSIDRKQRQIIEEKKQALGQRSSGHEYDYSEEQTM